LVGSVISHSPVGLVGQSCSLPFSLRSLDNPLLKSWKRNTIYFDVILVTPERVLVSQHRPDAESLISILKCLKAKSYVLSGRVLIELPRPSALRKRLMHFPFEIIIWDTKVF
jgi:hypothetical protein